MCLLIFLAIPLLGLDAANDFNEIKQIFTTGPPICVRGIIIVNINFSFIKILKRDSNYMKVKIIENQNKKEERLFC